LGPGREQYLEALLDSIVLRDVVLRHKLRDVALLRKILVYFSDNIGNLLSARTIAGVLKNERRSLSVETIYNYLEYLKQAFVVYEAKPYDIRGKRLLETGGKVYLADLGLRHALLGFRASDIGQYLENILYLELCKRGWKVSVGRVGEWEVDFRAEKGDLRSYFQVAYLTPDAETLERELRPLRAIRDNCPKFLLTMDPLPASSEEGIQRMPLVEFLTQAVD
jgi:predicted AAA+ superfamily ATPase